MSRARKLLKLGQQPQTPNKMVTLSRIVITEYLVDGEPKVSIQAPRVSLDKLHQLVGLTMEAVEQERDKKKVVVAGGLMKAG